MSAMTDIVERARKAAVCIYIAADETVATEIAGLLRELADEIERLDLKLAEARMQLAGGVKLVDAADRK